MKGINLSSLNIFWNSVKNYINSYFLNKTILWSGNPSNNVTLSETIKNFELIELECNTNDNTRIIRYFPSNTEYSQINLFDLSVWNDNGYFKMTSYSIADPAKLVFSCGKEATFKGSGGISMSVVSSSLINIVKVTGFKRIANN